MKTLQETIQDDIKQAMKSGQTSVRDTLRMIKDAVEKVEKKALSALDQSGVEAVITTFKKQLEESLEYAVKAADDVAINKLKAEIEIAKQYLPQQLSEEEIKALVMHTLWTMEASARNIGNIMKQINPLTKGKADGKLVNAIVTQSLKEV